MFKALLMTLTLLLAGACSTAPPLVQGPERSLIATSAYVDSLLETRVEQEHDGESARTEEGDEHGNEHEGEHEHNKRVVSFFLGGGTNDHDDSGFAFGLDYEHKLTPKWGVGAFGEGATGDLRSLVGGVLAFYHPIEPLTLVLGPGFEREPEDHIGDADWAFIVRVGGSYEFPISKDLFLAPAIYYDYSEASNTLIFGIALGTSF